MCVVTFLKKHSFFNAFLICFLYSARRCDDRIAFYLSPMASLPHCPMKHSSQSLHPLFAIAALTLLLAACSSNTNTTAALPESTDTPDTTASSTSSVADTPAVVTEKKYTDGTYSATGNYRSPAGAETVDVTLTLKDGVISDAVFKGEATAPRSMQMQSQFAAGFKEQVVGKSIDSLSLGVVNGSSLTPKGFMDAVQRIKTQATAS